MLISDGVSLLVAGAIFADVGVSVFDVTCRKQGCLVTPLINFSNSFGVWAVGLLKMNRWPPTLLKPILIFYNEDGDN